MTVRITVLEEREGRRIRVEGRLSCEEIEELERTIDEAPGRACLDLSELRSADAVALTLLRLLKLRGLELRGLPPHLAWRIEDDSK